MNWLQEQLRNTSPPDLLLHLGAGNCRELGQWLKAGAKRIVLVEPNPELLPELRVRSADLESVEILAVAIAAQAGRGALRLFNFPMLSSLREPTGLYQLLPGLAQIGRAMVETVSVDQLLDDLELNPEGEHWLVIDTPGEEAAILEQLEQSARLHDFSRILLSAGAEALYQGAEAAPALIKRLEDLGYNTTGRPDDSDGDWPRHHLALNRLALECRQVWQELEQAEALGRREAERAHALAAERDQLQEQLAQAQKAHSNEIQALKAQLAEAEQAHQSELEALKQQLSELQKSSSDKISQLEAALEARDKSLAEADQAIKQAEGQQHARVAELNKAHESQLQTLQQQLTEQQNARKSETEKLKQQLAEAQQADQSEQQKLQTKLGATEKEANSLRQKITELEQSNRKLHEEYQRKEALIDEEFLKAESQLELIKELVFRDKPV